MRFIKMTGLFRFRMFRTGTGMQSTHHMDGSRTKQATFSIVLIVEPYAIKPIRSIHQTGSYKPISNR